MKNIKRIFTGKMTCGFNGPASIQNNSDTQNNNNDNKIKRQVYKVIV